MKIIFCTTFFSMMTFCALGQRPDPGQFTGRIEDYYNFFGVSKSVNDEWIEEVHNSDTLTMIEIVNDLDHKIIAARRFFNNTHIISEEYLRLEKDTFMYISYSPESHKITSQGVVVPSICCELIDTLITTDPETYETVFWLERYWNFSKERHWKYTYNEYYYSQGNYENNRRVGEWYERDSTTAKGKYMYFDNSGNLLYEEPENIIEIQDPERIKKELVGTWTPCYGSKFAFCLRRIYDTENQRRDHIVITPDSITYDRYGGCGADYEYYLKTKTSLWQIDQNNTLSFDMYRYPKSKFRIIYLDRNHIEGVYVD